MQTCQLTVWSLMYQVMVQYDILGRHVGSGDGHEAHPRRVRTCCCYYYPMLLDQTSLQPGGQAPVCRVWQGSIQSGRYDARLRGISC